MKRIVSFAGIFALVFGVSSPVFAGDPPFEDAEDPVEVMSPIEELFVPSGFDDNDKAEVVLHGVFPSTCYRVANTGYELDEAQHIITVWATAYKYESELCTQTRTPFIQEVDLGILDEGDYTVKVKNTRGLIESMHIRERTTESPDEFFYAPVESAELQVDKETGRQSIMLKGNYPIMLVGCAELSEVRTKIKPEDVMVVKPILEVKQGDECNDHKLSFKKTYGLPQPFYGKGLMHVRVLNGNSLNKLIEVE